MDARVSNFYHWVSTPNLVTNLSAYGLLVTGYNVLFSGSFLVISHSLSVLREVGD